MSDTANFQEHIEAVRKDFEKRVGQTSDLAPIQEKEIVKEIVQEKFSPRVSVQSSSQTVPQSDDQGTGTGVQTPPASTHKDLEQQYQRVVDGFIQNALTGDLGKVVQAVNNSNNPWVIDQFHDTLVDKFYSEIKARQQRPA
ncbi:MAG: hypothetical protein UX65_C0008G0009 [Parcubacteria group bacterium GW2011_GWB1_46_8]|nr:MAG: hypothetical protein UX15_C0026G0006 [Parcubacteria group bacterium GW2011_GWA1_45_7]KKU10970.1 MAG: hypothetical protein UX14_C0006G0015 [Parcubacteria group bacterium GW2011_GWF1_45_5]KKU44001.1 MAG: hypothetical protein UX61_C0007G0013 [Parcubacteria group bacterium GW2011_GWA2_46_7]KKU46157.1 MAG: hypothetical protein UX65_C0008G0009 [Parcubacteria group bacterium GW2011_GWB1_46_8]KKU47361.1 MAG: hypothetical protein UX66_C0016G0023 [Parcubacteria group bacterium GW2011_GWF2_46_8]